MNNPNKELWEKAILLASRRACGRAERRSSTTLELRRGSKSLTLGVVMERLRYQRLGSERTC